MKVTYKIALVSGLLLATIAAYTATTGSTSNIIGNYKCERVDPTSHSTKSYPVTISSTGETYTLQWANPNGYPAMYGTGVMTKTMNNVMSVVFWDAKDNTMYGNEIFEIKPDGSLNANWVIQSDSNIGTETCTKG